MRRVYQVIAIFAIAQLLALSGFIGTLASRGALQPDRLENALRALRGDAQPPPAATTQPASQPASTRPARELLPEDEDAARIRRTELDRREREIADQWDLVRSAQVELLREREKFAAEKKEWEAALKRQAEEAALSGAAKEMEYLSGVKPETAKSLIRQKKDADVVQILLQMNSRIGRKIIEQCKTEDERLWIGRILEQLRQRNTRQAEALTAGQESR